MHSLMKQYSLLVVTARADFSSREKGKGLYADHHICPTCLRLDRGLAQDNRPENLVRLTHAEHYEAHRLLHLLYPKHYGLATAFFLMSHQNSVQVDAEAYASAQTLANSQSGARMLEYNSSPSFQAKRLAGLDEYFASPRAKANAEATSERNVELAAVGLHASQKPENRLAQSKLITELNKDRGKEDKLYMQTAEGKSCLAKRNSDKAAEGLHPAQLAAAEGTLYFQTEAAALASSLMACVRNKAKHTCVNCCTSGKGPGFLMHHFDNCHLLKQAGLHCNLADKPSYQCNLCGLAYLRQADLTKHFNTKHKLLIAP